MNEIQRKSWSPELNESALFSLKCDRLIKRTVEQPTMIYSSTQDDVTEDANQLSFITKQNGILRKARCKIYR